MSTEQQQSPLVEKTIEFGVFTILCDYIIQDDESLQIHALALTSLYSFQSKRIFRKMTHLTIGIMPIA